jgi:hypothetical protein
VCVFVFDYVCGGSGVLFLFDYVGCSSGVLSFV